MPKIFQTIKDFFKKLCACKSKQKEEPKSQPEEVKPQEETQE